MNKAHEALQMERIKELQRLDEGLTTELQWEVQSARSKLQQIQEIYAALCRHELEVRKLKGVEGP